MSQVQKKPALAQIMEYMDEKPEMQDLFSFNETFQSIQFLKDIDGIEKGTILRDDHVTMIRWRLTQEYNATIQRNELEDALLMQAYKHKINPVKDYLEALKWDKKPRLDHWLKTYAGAQDNIYIREAGKICLTAAVARIYEPGIKYDNLLVIEGDQGSGKSRFVEALGGAWFLDMAVKESDKDIVDEMRGAWIIEISELAGFSKKEVDWLKAFLSRRTDRCRLSYGRRSQDFPRQSIFIGTMNPSGDNSYLKDDTGNRRFWPVQTGKMDVEGLTKARNQLFAEAKHLYHAGQKLYLEGVSLKIAEEEQTERNMVDPWNHTIRGELPRFVEVTMPQLLSLVGLRTEFHGISETIRIGRIMRKLGWKRIQRHTGERYYIRGKEDQNDNQEEVKTSEEDRPDGRIEDVGPEDGRGLFESEAGAGVAVAEEMPDFDN